MTVLPQPPDHLLTVAEYAELGEITSGSSELHEGNIIMSPSSTPRHMIASGRLLQQAAASPVSSPQLRRADPSGPGPPAVLVVSG